MSQYDHQVQMNFFEIIIDKEKLRKNCIRKLLIKSNLVLQISFVFDFLEFSSTPTEIVIIIRIIDQETC